MAALEEEKKRAIAGEDYDLAHELKLQIEKLVDKLSAGTQLSVLRSRQGGLGASLARPFAKPSDLALAEVVARQRESPPVSAHSSQRGSSNQSALAAQASARHARAQTRGRSREGPDGSAFNEPALDTGTNAFLSARRRDESIVHGYGDEGDEYDAEGEQDSVLVGPSDRSNRGSPARDETDPPVCGCDCDCGCVGGWVCACLKCTCVQADSLRKLVVFPWLLSPFSRQAITLITLITLLTAGGER